jgi:hypothetical protein
MPACPACLPALPALPACPDRYQPVIKIGIDNPCLCHRLITSGEQRASLKMKGIKMTNTATFTYDLNTYYSDLNALLVSAIQGQRGIIELSDFAKQVIELVNADRNRLAYGADLSRSQFFAVVDLYCETFLDPYDIA